MPELATAAPKKREREPALDTAAVVGALPDAVLVIDADDVVRYVNPAAEQFFDTGAGVLCERGLDELAPFVGPLFGLVAKVRDGLATITEYDIELVSPRRKPRAVDVQVAAMTSNSVSKNQLLFLMLGTMASAVARVRALKPHWASGRPVKNMAFIRRL